VHHESQVLLSSLVVRVEGVVIRPDLLEPLPRGAAFGTRVLYLSTDCVVRTEVFAEVVGVGGWLCLVTLFVDVCKKPWHSVIERFAPLVVGDVLPTAKEWQ